MMDFISSHKLMSLAVVVLLVGVAWWELTGSSSSSSAVLTTSTDAGDSQDSQLVSTLLELQAVTLNGTILSDPGFQSLQDYTTQIVSVPLGRPDPFAPISPGASTASSSVKVNPNLFAPAKH